MRKTGNIWQAVVLATFIGAGFATLWGIVAAWGHETTRSYEPMIAEDKVAILADGTAILERIQYQRRGRYQPVVEYRNLEGHPVQMPADSRELSGVGLAAETRGGFVGGFLTQDTSWDSRIRQFADQRDPRITWYFISDGVPHGSAYLVAFDTEDSRRVGYLGTAGFRQEPLPPQELIPFNGTPWGGYFRIVNLQNDYGRGFYPMEASSWDTRKTPPLQLYVQGDDDKIYQFNLAERTVHVALEGQPIRSFGVLERAAGPKEPPKKFLVVRTDDHVVMLDRHNQVVRRFPIPNDLRDRGFTYFETDNGVVISTQKMDPEQPGINRTDLSWYDTAGRQTRREQVAVERQSGPTMRWAAGLMMPLPLGLGVVFGVIVPLEQLYVFQNDEYQEVLRKQMTEIWPSLLVVGVLSAILAGLCYLRLARYRASRSERLIWTVFVFLFGLPGWIGFRFARPWPIRERCPACGAVVPQDRVSCAACAAEFPLPALKGTEVFA